MKNLSRYVLSFFLFSSLSSAQEVKPEIQLGSDLALIYPMSKGQAAPFPGVLLTPSAAVKIATEYMTFEDRIRLEVDTAVRISQAKMLFDLKEQETRCDSAKSVQHAQIESRDERIQVLEKEIKEKQEEVNTLKESTPNRATWFGLGFASAMIFTIATAYAVGQVVN